MVVRGLAIVVVIVVGDSFGQPFAFAVELELIGIPLLVVDGFPTATEVEQRGVGRPIGAVNKAALAGIIERRRIIAARVGRGRRGIQQQE